MSSDSTEKVRCPLCDGDFEVYGCHVGDLYTDSRSQYTVVLKRSAVRGWRTCPLCKGNGEILKALWSAFQLRFADVLFRQFKDLESLVEACDGQGGG